MRRSKLKLISIATLALMGLVAIHRYQVREDRSTCMRHLRNMHIQIYSVAGVKGINPGEPFPGGARELLQLAEDETMPTCPAGGTYTFRSDDSYSIDLRENVRCSHADDLDHKWTTSE